MKKNNLLGDNTKSVLWINLKTFYNWRPMLLYRDSTFHVFILIRLADITNSHVEGVNLNNCFHFLKILSIKQSTTNGWSRVTVTIG